MDDSEKYTYDFSGYTADEVICVSRVVNGKEINFSYTPRAWCRFALANVGWTHDRIDLMTDDELWKFARVKPPRKQ